MTTRPHDGGSLPAVIVLVLGLIGTCIAASFVREHEVGERGTFVAQGAAEYVEALKGQLIRSREVLFAIEALLLARPETSRREFHDFVANALSRRPEIQGLAWDPRVEASARLQWETRAHEDGFASFRIVEKSGGMLVPAGERPEYFPVFFMEHVARNEPALGFDLLSEARRRTALERARDTGLAAATPPITLVQEPGSQLGFLVLLPVYGRPVTSIDERRRSLRGFAVAAYRIGDLLNATLQPAISRGLGITITDIESGQVIFQGGQPLPGGEPWETTIDMAGRPWTMRFESSAAFGGSTLFWQAWASLGGGIVISLLLSAYLWSHSRRTAELAISNQTLHDEIGIRKQAEARAESASRAKSSFLANMSHEIRTPLNAILGYADILVRRGRLDAFEREAVQTIAGSSGHLLHVINEILDLSKIDAGRMELTRAAFDLDALVREIVVMFQPLCDEKGLEMRVEGPDIDRCRRVVGDAGKLRQVVINLLGNAVKFTEAGTVTLRVIAAGDDRWRFEVRDTGPGIARGMRECIFEPFQQGATRNEKGGTGLGLSIARRQVELMGSTLSLESGETCGSTFAFTVYLPSASVWHLPAALSCDAVRLAAGQRVRALIVDDVLENRKVLSTILSMAGCETRVAENAGCAIESARDFAPNIVFVDLRLPESNGLDTAHRLLNELAGDLRVVAMSASVLDGERERCLSDGCDAFVAKPYRADQIYTCVADVLGVTFESDCDPAGAAMETGTYVEPMTLPLELASRLSRAAELHSATSLRRCLHELDDLGPDGHQLADHLRGFLASYDMDAIQRIVGGLAAASSSQPS